MSHACHLALNPQCRCTLKTAIHALIVTVLLHQCPTLAQDVDWEVWGPRWGAPVHVQGEQEAQQTQEDLPVRVRVDVVQLGHELRSAVHTGGALRGQEVALSMPIGNLTDVMASCTGGLACYAGTETSSILGAVKPVSFKLPGHAHPCPVPPLEFPKYRPVWAPSNTQPELPNEITAPHAQVHTFSQVYSEFHCTGRGRAGQLLTLKPYTPYMQGARAHTLMGS